MEQRNMKNQYIRAKQMDKKSQNAETLGYGQLQLVHWSVPLEAED